MAESFILSASSTINSESTLSVFLCISAFISNAFQTRTGRCFINKSQIRTQKSLVDSHKTTSHFSGVNQFLRFLNFIFVSIETLLLFCIIYNENGSNE